MASVPPATDQSRLVASLVITLAGVAIGVGHMVWPAVAIDGVTTALFVVAVSPWLGYVFKAVELPGLGRFEYPDFERSKAELTKAGLVAPVTGQRDALPPGAESDPLIALAALRIELEKRLRQLANVSGVKIADRPGSIRMLAQELGSSGVITRDEASALADMAGTLNRAVHAQPVSQASADWVFSVGSGVLASLDQKVSIVAASASRS